MAITDVKFIQIILSASVTLKKCSIAVEKYYSYYNKLIANKVTLRNKNIPQIFHQKK